MQAEEVRFAVPLLDEIDLNKLVPGSPWRRQQKFYLQVEGMNLLKKHIFCLLLYKGCSVWLDDCSYFSYEYFSWSSMHIHIITYIVLFDCPWMMNLMMPNQLLLIRHVCGWRWNFMSLWWVFNCFIIWILMWNILEHYLIAHLGASSCIHN